MRFNSVIVGIDIGITGAVAILTACGSRILHCFDIPTESRGSSAKKQINVRHLNRLLGESIVKHSRDELGESEVKICMESLNGRPGQSCTSTFSLGDSYGVVRGIASLYSNQVVMVSPQKWKAASKLTGKTKSDSIVLARSIWPESSIPYLTMQKHHDRAEAVLIGYWLAKR